MKWTRRQERHDARSASLPRLQVPLSSEDPRRADGGVSEMRGGELAARRRLGGRGYRIHSGALFYVVNDDPEDFRESLVANWDGTAHDAWTNLEAHGFPTSPFILCRTCQSGEADFGGECVFCARESVKWQKVGEV